MLVKKTKKLMGKFLNTLGEASKAASPWISIASGIGSLFGHNSNIDKSIAAQERENEKNRQYNLKLAQMQNRWNLDQWNRENAYNDPKAVMARLAAAGLNPDLMYNNGAGSLTAASSPGMTSGAPSSPVDMSPLANKQTVGEMYQSIQQSMLNDEIINKTKQEGRKTGFEADSASVEAFYKAAKEQQDLKIGDTTIVLNGELANVNRKQADSLVANMNKIAEETNLLMTRRHEILASIENLDADTANKKLEGFLRTQEFELLVKETTAKINNLNANTHLTYTQAQDIVATQLARISNLNASAYLSRQTGILNHEKATTEILAQAGLSISNETASFNLEQAKTFDSAERIASIAFLWSSAISQAAGSFTGFLKGAQLYKGAPKIKGFGK